MSLAQQRWMRWSVSPSRRLAAMSRNRACNRRELIVSCEAPSRCDGIGRRDGLKIRWANHPCGFDPRHRHQTNKIRTRSSLWETGSDLLFISIFLRRHTSKTDFRSFLRANPVHIGIERKNTKMEVCQNERSNQKMRVQYG